MLDLNLSRNIRVLKNATFIPGWKCPSWLDLLVGIRFCRNHGTLNRPDAKFIHFHHRLSRCCNAKWDRKISWKHFISCFERCYRYLHTHTRHICNKYNCNTSPIFTSVQPRMWHSLVSGVIDKECNCMERHKPFEHRLLCWTSVIGFYDSVIFDEGFEIFSIVKECPKVAGWPMGNDEGAYRAAHPCVS